ncbi:MAG: LysM peptidoglycan-binding domain-containing protein [Nitrospirae bacterium]|nr:LysM peptidoglycan-binding domain-containing protein [Nitrospirota bacterium]
MKISLSKCLTYLLLFLLTGCASPNSYVPDYRYELNAPPSPISVNKDSPALPPEEKVLAEPAGASVDEEQPAKPPVSVDSKTSGDLSAGKKEVQNMLDTALDLCDASQEYWSKGELEEAIDALDEAYSLVLKAETDDNPELFQQKEDLRFTISKRITEIYASRYTAVDGRHDAIPMIMNKYIEDEIKFFQGPARDFFMESYRRSGKYREAMLKTLKEAGLPAELSWLPLIESGFKVRALSTARALGLWQFIPSTGYKFGLTRDTWIDERMDPEKATAAAIEYLKELHNIFGDWSTVLAGYNCGEWAVLRIIQRQQINYLDNFWDLYERLPRETARYVPMFLATLHIMKDPKKYGFEFEEPYKPTLFESVTIEKQVHLEAVAGSLVVSFDSLIDLNPELRQHITPNTPYALKVPYGKGEELLAKLESIPNWAAPEPATRKARKEYVYHKVRRGETLAIIAAKYKSTLPDIAKANRLKQKSIVHAGQTLKIPVKGGAGEKRIALKDELLQGGKYRVKRGDSLYLVAKKFNTDTKTLKRLNALKTAQLYVGQVLKVTR